MGVRSLQEVAGLCRKGAGPRGEGLPGQAEGVQGKRSEANRQVLQTRKREEGRRQEARRLQGARSTQKASRAGKAERAGKKAQGAEGSAFSRGDVATLVGCRGRR